MRRLRSILAILVAALLFTVSIPMDGITIQAATVSDSTDIVLGGEDSITRAEWLHNLVTVFEMTVESGAEPDNYFSDLDENHEYYSDIILALEFGVINVAAGEAMCPDEPVTRDFAANS